MEAWWFSRADGALGYGDGRIARVGETHTVEGPAVLHARGMHGSEYVADALAYASGPLLWRVRIGGDIAVGGDQVAGTERTYLACFDARAMLHAYVRWYALSSAHLWDVPDVVARWLVTGDESLIATAMDVARDAARAAAWGRVEAAAWDLTWAALSTAERDDAGAAVWDVAAAIVVASHRTLLETMTQSLRTGDCWWSA